MPLLTQACFAILLLALLPAGLGIPSVTAMELSGLDPNTAGTQPGDPWYEASVGSFPGFCLSASAGRVLLNWSSPLYSRAVTLSPSNPNLLNFLNSWVAKLLLEELLGYAVLLHDPLNNPNDVYGDITAGLVDAAVSVFMEPSQDGPELAQYTRAGQVLYYGEQGVASRGGLYFPQRLLELYPQLSLELWRSYQLSDPLSAQALPLFIEDSWAALNQSGVNLLLVNQSDPTSLVCPSDAVLEAENGGSPLADCGCVEGIYYPPQCLPNPRQQCALMFIDHVWLDPGLSQNLVRNLNLGLAVAFISNFSATVQALTLQQRGVLFYAQDVNPLSLMTCSQPNSSLSEPCFARVFFPTYDVSCDALTDNSDRGNYTCDYPYQYIVKLSSPPLPELAPRVTHLLTQMSLSPSDARAMLGGLNLQAAAGNATDYKRAACDWLTANPDEWSGWIAPPAECGYADMQYSLSGCSDQAEAALTFAWTAPKACVGGLALPQDSSVSCGYATFSSQAGDVAAAVVLCVLLLALVADQAVLCALGMRLPAALPQQPTLARRILQSYQSRSQRLGRLAAWTCSSAVGALLLLAVVLVNSLTVSDSQCRARFTLLVLGLTTVGSSLLCAMRDFALSSRRRLQTNGRGWGDLRWIAVIALSNAVVLACLVLDGSSIGANTQIVDGFVPLSQPLCQRPSLFITVPLLAINTPWIALLCLTWSRFATSLLLRHFAQQQPVAAADTVAVHESKPTIQRQQLRPAVWRLFLLLSAAIALWIVLLAVLLPSLMTSALYERNVWIISYQAAAVLVGAALLWLLALLPSLQPLRLCARQRSIQVRSSSSMSETSTKRSSTAWMTDRDFALTAIFADPVLLACLTAFMETTFDAENVRFLVDVREFNARVRQWRLDRAPKPLLAEACSLFHTYLAANAPSQINVGSAQLTTVKQRLEALAGLCEVRLSPSCAEWEQLEKAALLCFADVSKECTSLLRVNGIPRFLSSSSGERANGLVEWAEHFDSLSIVEQRAVIARCKSRMTNEVSEKSERDLRDAPRALPSRLMGNEATVAPV